MIQDNKNFLLFSTTGNSMFPCICWNEQILVERLLPEDMRIGDVVLFQSNKGHKVCHRIVKIEQKNGSLWFQTKGDRHRTYDEPVSQQAILGKVIAVKRKMRLREIDTKQRPVFLYKLYHSSFCCIFGLKKFLRFFCLNKAKSWL